MICRHLLLIRVCMRKRKWLLIVSVLLLTSICLYRLIGAGTNNHESMASHFDSGSDFQTCVHPELPLWSKEAHAYLTPVSPVVCNEENDWVYTRNGRFYISEEAERRHGKVRCTIWPIVNVNDSMIYWKPINKFKNGTKLLSDAFSVLCLGRDGAKYRNVHPCIKPSTMSANSEFNTADRFNIFIYGFDSLSRNMFKRMMPKTHAYFTNELEGMLLEGYNIVGDGTTNALMSMLTGRIETETPEVRRGKPGAKFVDKVVTFIWKRYQRLGYVTQWGEDMAHIGTFQFRLLGFKDQPVDHYMRAFQLYARENYQFHKPLCLGSRPRHIVFLEWLKEGLVTNLGHNFFTFGFFSELSHENNNPIRLTDNDNVEFLKFMSENGYLENTILILMSDHGIRYGSIRETEVGKLEERMPYFGILFPERFQNLYPRKMEAFKTNTKRLSTPYDVHETLVEILDETEASERLDSGKYRGISLFQELPKYRTCQAAGISSHWCACMRSTHISIHDPDVKAAALKVVALINELLTPHESLCHTVKLIKIEKATVFENNEDVLKFKRTLDRDGRVPDLSDKLKTKEHSYQVTFRTSPRDALYEATIRKDLEDGAITANELHISRLNKYGDAPYCLADKHPEVRPYCVCKNGT